MANGPFWIPIETEGRPATMARPLGGVALEPALRELATEGVTLLVSLLSPEEQQGLDLSGEAAACAGLGLSFRSHPVPDFEVPSDEVAFWSLARQVRDELEDGGVIVIHCHGGIGRSSLLAAAALTLLGRPALDAFASIAEVRDRPVPDTTAQRAWLVDSSRRHGGTSP